ncbi:MAG: sarcosine oxidase subunit alpha family protein [Coxiellaceae bacterium]|nr:sarcosine oxidase subunit alpha family protein [Coxiellaceae bacterium]
MTQVNRLSQGGRIKREKRINFTFNGCVYTGYQGDTIASALMANNIKTVGLSFKYRRARGIVGSGAEEPNAIFQLDEGAYTIPNVRATQTELTSGMVINSVGPRNSMFKNYIISKLHRLMAPGFYYKTFIKPKFLWPYLEKKIRANTGLGYAPTEKDNDTYDKLMHYCDVLIVGAGPAGLSAAWHAANTKARVIIVDEQNELGGCLLSENIIINKLLCTDWLKNTVDGLKKASNVIILKNSTAFGYYDHNLVAAKEVCDEYKKGGESCRERLHRIRAKHIILATGSIERPLVFSNNDRPGVMLSSAVNVYIRRYGVLPGKNIVLFTANDTVYLTALAILEVGGRVAAIVDCRSEVSNALLAPLKKYNVEVLFNHAVIDVQGEKAVSAAVVAPVDNDVKKVIAEPFEIACDIIASSGGYSPVIHLHSHTGCRPQWSDQCIGFVPGNTMNNIHAVGACTGAQSISNCLSEGAKASIKALSLCGIPPNITIIDYQVENEIKLSYQAVFSIPHTKSTARAPKQFVDYQLDVTKAGIEQAASENFTSIEHVKRYTALGFGTDQGKLGNINGMAILAEKLGQSIPETGTTIFRPAYTPITFGAIAGRDVDQLFDPVRKTALHRWHEGNGAKFENVAQWRRPWYYPKDNESMHEAVNRECLAVRHGVGIIDASTLGKIDIQGPDAAEFLNRVYTNAYLKLGVGKCRYGLLLNEDGMVFDDGVCARLGENHYLMFTTTGGAAHVFQHLERWHQTEWPDLKVYFTSVTDHFVTATVTGPDARKVISKVCSDIDLSSEQFKFMDHRQGTVAGVEARVFRISFTGELTFEVNVNANYGHHVWQALINAGAEFNITPYGTETMHVLRAEKGFVIVGQDTDGSVTPTDLNMNWVLSKKKPFSYIGKRGLARKDLVRQDRKQLVGLVTKHPNNVVPEGAQIVNDKTSRIPADMQGHVTSSYYSAALNQSIALALIKSGLSRIGETVYCYDPAEGMIEATISESIFYDKSGARQHV